MEEPIYGIDLELEIPSNVEYLSKLLPNLTPEFDYKVLENREGNKNLKLWFTLQEKYLK